MKKTFRLSTLTTTKERLALLSEKPKETLSSIEAVDVLRDTIQALRAKGYTWDDISAELAKDDIIISKYMLSRAIIKKPIKKKKDAGTDGK